VLQVTGLPHDEAVGQLPMGGGDVQAPDWQVEPGEHCVGLVDGWYGRN
jgi:hypothetical protein